MNFASDQIDEIVSLARNYLQGHVSESDVRAWDSTRDFAQVLVQLAGTCVIGLACERHTEAVHGKEAEELRAGIERILRYMGDADEDDELHAFRETRQKLIALLDHVDARDSLAFREATDPPAASAATNSFRTEF